MDARWFKEDRALPSDQRAAAKEESEKALRNSTLLIRRLTAILSEEVHRTYTKEESYTGRDWERVVYGQFKRRETLKEIIKLLP